MRGVGASGSVPGSRLSDACFRAAASQELAVLVEGGSKREGG